ncbi:MAG: vWA domain-containing protein [Candidatus Nanohaloarchaea archaeon]|nr:vWA domain-containing protein [Candidatus Nanohaloarchaea archaeon]
MAGIERPVLLIVAAVALLPLYQALKRDGEGRVISLLRALLIVVLALAVAGPYIIGTKPVSGEPQIVILKDKSRSAGLMENQDPEFDDVQVRERIIASGNSSDIRNGILRNLRPRTNYLLVSDLQSEDRLEGLAEEFNRRNSTLNAFKPEMEQELSVKIEGPESTVVGAENRYVVRVRSTESAGKVPEPEVKLDGNKVELDKQSEGVWSFSWEFSGQGSHRMEAGIGLKDEFRGNNRYYKSVRVIDKPKIVSVGDKGGLEEKLGEFYDIDQKERVPEELEKYYAVILKEEVGRDLKEYTSRGNGVIFTGDLEKDRMDVLPVRTIPEGEQKSGAKIALAIDASLSTGNCKKWDSDNGRCIEYGSGRGIKKSQQIAYSLVDILPFNNKIGAVAYNDQVYRISKPQPLAYNREKLKDRISRIAPDGPSFHNRGIKGAGELLNGTGNIILISDGKLGGLGANENVDRKAKQVARNLDVRLITVGVGEDADTEFLQELARLGGGMYMDAESSGRLNFMFNAGGAEGKTEGLVAVDQHHPITRGLEMKSQVVFTDSVAPRKGSELLATTTTGKPFLTVWNYGLGRVGAFSAGGDDLQRVLAQDPRIVTRAMSWAVGSPERKKDKWVRAESGRRNEKVELKASYRLPGLKRKGKDLYAEEIRPDDVGFHRFQDQIYSYNYHPEIENIGYSDKIEDLVSKTGGKVYSSSEVKELVEDTKEFSSRQVETRKSLSSYLLIVGLVVFLAEVGYRKQKGMK